MAGELEERIREQLDRGHTKREIKKQLEKQGYRESLIEIMFEDLERGKKVKRKRMGWLESVKNVIGSPDSFFSKMPTSGGFKPPLRFASINLTILGVIFGLIVSFMLSFILSILTLATGKGGTALNLIKGVTGFGIISIPLVIVASLIVGIISIFVTSGILHVLLLLFGGKGNFEGTFRVMAYTTALLILAWIPFVNIFVAFYAVYIEIVGFSKVHRISKKRTFLAIILPTLILALIFLLGGFIKYLTG